MSNLNKTVLVLAFVAGAFGSVSAKDVKWIGDDGGDWDVGANWEGGEKPGNNDTAVFEIAAGATLTVDLTADARAGNLKVSGGTLVISDSTLDPKPSDQYKRTLFLGGDGTEAAAHVTVAAGATFEMHNMIKAPSHLGYDLVFDGEGFVDGRSYLGSNGQQWKTIAFRKGSYKCNGSGYDKIYGTNLWLGVNVALTAGSGSWPNAIQNSPTVHLSEGATILVSTETVSGLFGTGTVLGTGSYKVTLNFSRGPCRFDGLIGATGKQVICEFGAQGELNDEDYRFVVGNGNMFEYTQYLSFSAGGRNPLEFAPGIGTFKFLSYTGKDGNGVDAALNLEDTDGEPVDMYVARFSNSGANCPNFQYLAFKGSGNLYLSTRSNGVSAQDWEHWSKPYTNDIFKGVTGEVRFYDLSTIAHFGDKTAGHDLDLSTVSKVVVEPNAKVVYQNAAADYAQPSDLQVNGTVTVDSPLNLTGELSGTGTITVNSPSKFPNVSENGNVKLVAAADTEVGAATEGRLESLWTGTPDTRITVNRGHLHGEYQRDSIYTQYAIWSYDGLYARGVPCAAQADRNAIRVENGAMLTYAYNASYYIRRLELASGGTFRQYGNDAPPKAADGSELVLDGGRYLVSPYFTSYGNCTIPSSKDLWTATVGAGGGTIEYDFIEKFADASWSEVKLNLGFSSPADVTSGPLHLILPCSATLYRPVTVNGPVYLDEAYLQFADNEFTRTAAADGSIFGTGDLHLGEAALRLFANAEGWKIGANAGQTVYYDGGARIAGRLNGQGAQTITLGNGAGPAVVRGGKGATFGLCDLQTGVTSIDGNGPKFLANGTVALDEATGLVKDPIFGYTYKSGAGSFYRWAFLTYDQEKGFVETDNFVDDDFSQGVDSIVKVAAEDMTLSESATVAALQLECRKLTLAQDATLKVGRDDASRTAQIVFNGASDGSWSGKYHGQILGKGTLDLGASEGVFMAERADNGLTAASAVNCRITGTGGLTVSGSPFGGPCSFALGGDNTYTGGTWINNIELHARHVNCLSSGDVHLGTSRISGGSIRFLTAGGNYTNDFYISGYGNRRAAEYASEYGCLVFNSYTNVISGRVFINRRARISDTRRGNLSNSFGSCKPGVGVFAGVISGGMLDISGPRDNDYPNPQMVFTAANTYTGGTFVAFHTVVLRGEGTLGTGLVELHNKPVLRFENTADKVFPNDIRGNGTVILAGSGDVSFTGRVTDNDEEDYISVDLADTAPVLKHLPPFHRIFNSSGKKTTLTLTAESTVDPAQLLELETVNLVLDGATLDLSGRTVDVRRLTCQNGGKVVNGTVNELNPAKGLLLIVR